VLRQGLARGGQATPDDIKALLHLYAARLQKIQGEYISCKERCPAVVHDQDKENFFKDLAREFKTTLEILAKVNGRPNLDPVSRQNLEYLLVPRPGSRGAPGVDRDMHGEQPRGVSLLPLRLRPLNSRP
jgi:hypothetical protein